MQTFRKERRKAPLGTGRKADRRVSSRGKSWERNREESMLEADKLTGAIARLKEILAGCTLCPRRCRVDRTRGQRGFCNLPARAVVNCALPHFGEEPPISGTSGSGTIFFASCNLRCRYCQNFQISHEVRGEVLNASALARMMLSLQDRGCHAIEPVTPTPHLTALLEALQLARGEGLHLPLVYNCSGYENPEIIRLLDGIVDLYLPDFKYGSDACASSLSGVEDYVAQALGSLREMVRQVGDTLIPGEGVAGRGLLIRHLVLPGQLENSREVLNLIKAHVSTAVPLSLMSQYTPIPAMNDFPPLNRRISPEEYAGVVDYALELGFEHLFIQEVDDRDLTPDFGQETPFVWP